MERDQHIWRYWARNLQLWGVNTWAVAFLEAAGPLTILVAQMVYFSEPIFSWMMPEGKFASLARLLEDSSNRETFIDYLREANAP
jgi:hypothetical protein